MPIYVAEPGRPLGIRLPPALRRRRVEDPSALTASGATRGVVQADHAPEQPYPYTDSSAEHRPPNKALIEYQTQLQGEATLRDFVAVRTLASEAPISIDSTGTLDSAQQLMQARQIHHLIVTHDGEIAGLIDLTWILSRMLDESHHPQPQPASLRDLELPAFMTVTPDSDARLLAREMLAHQLDAALVLDAQGALTGIITTTDFLRLYARHREEEVLA